MNVKSIIQKAIRIAVVEVRLSSLRFSNKIKDNGGGYRTLFDYFKLQISEKSLLWENDSELNWLILLL